MARDWVLSVAQRREVGESRLAWAVLFGTIPAGLVGLVLRDDIETTLRSPLVIACTTIGYAVLLFAADRFGSQQRDERSSRLARRGRDRLRAGARADSRHLALGRDDDGGAVPGMSRQAAARFSFLLAVPVTAAAGLSEVGGYAEHRCVRSIPALSFSVWSCPRRPGSPASITCSSG